MSVAVWAPSFQERIDHVPVQACNSKASSTWDPTAIKALFDLGEQLLKVDAVDSWTYQGKFIRLVSPQFELGLAQFDQNRVFYP